MTRENFTRWTCNICGGIEETTGSAQPKDWVGYGFTVPDAPAGEPRDIGHLCGGCHDRLVTAMTKTDTPPTPAPSPEPVSDEAAGAAGVAS